jgi:hypothetical protein
MQNPPQLIRKFPNFHIGIFYIITQIITQINTFLNLYYLLLFLVIPQVKEGDPALSNSGGSSSFRDCVDSGQLK